MCDDNRNRLFCLNSQLQPCGEAFMQQPVQSSSIAWRALCRAAPYLCKSRHPPHSAQRLWASNTSTAAGKRCGSPTCTFLLSSTALHCVGLVWALPRRTAPCSCTQCGGFKTSNGFELPKGQNQVLENEEMKNIEYSFEIIGLGGWWPFVREKASQARSCLTEVGQAWKC